MSSAVAIHCSLAIAHWTVVIDEVHARSVQSDCTLALTLLAMQSSDRVRLVIMSATGDHDLVNKRIARCQRLILQGAMQKVCQTFLSHPTQRSDHLLFTMAQVVIDRHNWTAGRQLVNHTDLNQLGGNSADKFLCFVPGVPQTKQLLP